MLDTRRNILEKNFEAMHRQGFQGLRPDKVIQQLGITKGAFYHYFAGKQELGYAIVDELIAPRYTSLWRQLDQYQGHPIDGIVQILVYLRANTDAEACTLGCPLNNLINEMAPLDEGFNTRLRDILTAMHQSATRALQRGKDQGLIQSHVEPGRYAYFILAALEGCFSIGKSMQEKAAFDAALNELMATLNALKTG